MTVTYLLIAAFIVLALGGILCAGYAIDHWHDQPRHRGQHRADRLHLSWDDLPYAKPGSMRPPLEPAGRHVTQAPARPPATSVVSCQRSVIYTHRPGADDTTTFRPIRTVEWADRMATCPIDQLAQVVKADQAHVRALAGAAA